MLDEDLIQQAALVLAAARAANLMIATAESCTGGLLAACLTETAGASAVFERGFVTYSNQAKSALLDVSPELLARFGAVSEQTARAMAQGALAHSNANITLAITGIAGPGGGSREKPVGLVCFGLATDQPPAVRSETHRFGDPGRGAIRRQATQTALALLRTAISNHPAARTQSDKQKPVSG